MSGFELKATQHGFKFGPADVIAAVSEGSGVYIQVQTPRETITIQSTPTGLIRVYTPDGACCNAHRWTPPEKG